MKNMTDRDRKIMFSVVPVVLLVAFWFLLMAPKRAEVSQAGASLAKAQQRLTEVRGKAASAEASKNTFAADYTSLVKLGKAVPSRLDMPTVIVQLEAAARGTGISFDKISTGDRAAGGSAPAPAPAQPPAAPGASSGSTPAPAAAGGAPAQSGPGKAAENTGNAVNNANDKSAASEKTGGASTTPSTPPAAAAGADAPVASTAPPGLDSVPLQLTFQGSFFHLADFFHSLKRFVHVANERISVRGRLLTVDSLHFKSDPQTFPKLTAELTATIYLAPVSQGATAGATPEGPATTTPPAGTTPTSGSGTPAPAPPAATAVR
jgi:hypothetical protein